MSDSIGYFAILSAIREYGLPDVVHLHWLQPFVISENPIKTAAGGIRLLGELLLLKLMGVTVVWTVHNVLEHRKRSPRLETLIKHFVVRLSDYVIVHCPAARRSIQEAYHLSNEMASKCISIPHGHYIDSYPNEQTRDQARNTLDIDSTDTTFLFFGQIRPYKNIPLLVETFKELNDDEARLLIVGNPWDENEAAEVRKRSKTDDRIRCIFEFVPEEEIQLYMNAADVVVLPFQDVLTSGSALLGMSFGNALIAPQIGCVAELLDPEGGVSYDPDTGDGLHRAMERALRADVAAMGEYNYRKAQRYDWESIARRTYELYTAV
ncbi:glycosyltransferase family 4 protein [Halalkalicoccus salilacus]